MSWIQLSEDKFENRNIWPFLGFLSRKTRAFEAFSGGARLPLFIEESTDCGPRKPLFFAFPMKRHMLSMSFWWDFFDFLFASFLPRLHDSGATAAILSQRLEGIELLCRGCIVLILPQFRLTTSYCGCVMLCHCDGVVVLGCVFGFGVSVFDCRGCFGFVFLLLCVLSWGWSLASLHGWQVKSSSFFSLLFLSVLLWRLFKDFRLGCLKHPDSEQTPKHA